MRYLIIGTGALGSVFGGLLQRSGQAVAVNEALSRLVHFLEESSSGTTTPFGTTGLQK